MTARSERRTTQIIDVLDGAFADLAASAPAAFRGKYRRMAADPAIAAALAGRRRAFAEAIVDFGIDYAAQVRTDHALFVEAFRSSGITVAAT